MGEKSKIIALIGLSTKGHHLAFMRLFSKALLDLNYKVIAFFPDNTSLESWLKENCPEKVHNYHHYQYLEPHFKTKGFGRFNDAVSVFKKWMHLLKAMKQAEKILNYKIDFVFFSWLDAFLANYLHPFFLKLFFRYKWSGLYMHPRHMRDNMALYNKKPVFSDVDFLLNWHNCKNIAVHDEGIIDGYKRRIRKNTILFPETAEDTLPKQNFAPILLIKERAASRKIVLIAGVLEKLKGLIYMIRLAKDADRDSFFFVFAGPISIIDYTVDEQKEISQFIDSQPENCFFYFEYIPEGEEFNAFIEVANILFIVYANFASSSNRLTKAAIFNKYVLGQDRFCVGEDVEKYGLGVTVEEGNIGQMNEGLEILKQKIEKEDFPFEKFKIYRELNSIEKLKERFLEVLKD